MSDTGETAARWYDGYDDDAKAFVAAKGYVNDDMATALQKAIRGHQSAEKHFGLPADQILRMPKDTTDPNYQTAYERIMALAVPQKPEEYVFDGVRFQDGTTLDPDDQKFLRDTAAKYKLTRDQAAGLAADLAARIEAAGASEGNEAATRRAANDIALRQTWNAEHDNKRFTAAQVAAAAGLPDGIIEEWAASYDTPKFIACMNALLTVAPALNDAAIHRGGGVVNRTPGSLDAEGAQRRLDELMADKGWADRYLNGGRAEQEEYTALRNISRDANVAARGYRR